MYTQTQTCIMHVCLEAQLLYISIFKKCVYATDVFISVETLITPQDIDTMSRSEYACSVKRRLQPVMAKLNQTPIFSRTKARVFLTEVMNAKRAPCVSGMDLD